MPPHEISARQLPLIDLPVQEGAAGAGRRWSANQVRLIRWLALPGANRQPPTLSGLAKRLKLRERTLLRWLRDPDLVLAAERAAGWRLTRGIPEILNVIYTKALGGDYRFVKLALDLTEELRQQPPSGEPQLLMDVDTRLRLIGAMAEEDHYRFQRARERLQRGESALEQGSLWPHEGQPEG